MNQQEQLECLNLDDGDGIDYIPDYRNVNPETMVIAREEYQAWKSNPCNHCKWNGVAPDTLIRLETMTFGINEFISIEEYCYERCKR